MFHGTDVLGWERAVLGQHLFLLGVLLYFDSR